MSESEIEADLLNKENSAKFKLTITSLVDSTFRVFVDEVAPLHPRYKVEESLNGKPQPDKYDVENITKYFFYLHVTCFF